MWQWLHRWGSPKWFYAQSRAWLLVLAVATAALLGTGLIWGLAFAPVDYQQGHSFRIIYIHVPAAVLAQNAYILTALAGSVFLIWHIKIADIIASVAVPIGMSFCALALLTGSLWGKPTWGAWWVWDARTTTTLLLLFLYLGLLVLRTTLPTARAAGRGCAILALVGVVNIPLIKYSVDWWFTLHQSATFKLTEAPAMPAAMYLPLLISGLGFALLFVFALLLWARLEVLARESNASWVAALTRPGAP